jgi:hypothetical protein
VICEDAAHRDRQVGPSFQLIYHPIIAYTITRQSLQMKSTTLPTISKHKKRIKNSSSVYFNT